MSSPETTTPQPDPQDVRPQDLEQGLAVALGFRFGPMSADGVAISLTIGEQHLQPYGIVHGGVYCALIESAASIGGAIWFGARGTVVGAANQTDFLRSARSGDLHASATPIHRGRSQQLWLVEVRDDAERLCARGQVRLQNLPA